jgi:hypothetical protein
MRRHPPNIARAGSPRKARASTVAGNSVGMPNPASPSGWRGNGGNGATTEGQVIVRTPVQHLRRRSRRWSIQESCDRLRVSRPLNTLKMDCVIENDLRSLRTARTRASGCPRRTSHRVRCPSGGRCCFIDSCLPTDRPTTSK